AIAGSLQVGIHFIDRAFHQHGDMIAAAQQQLGQLRGKRQLLCTQPVEDVLDDMGEADHMLQPEDARRALDGVHAAEQRVQELRLARGCLQLEQDALHVGQHLPTFVEKSVEDLIEIHRAGSWLAAGISTGSPSSASTLSRVSTSSTGSLWFTSCSASPRSAAVRLASSRSCRPAVSNSVTAPRSISRSLPLSSAFSSS